MFQTKVVEKLETQISCSIIFSRNRDVYEMGKNIVERGMPQTTIWRMRIACFVPKATNRHTGGVMLIAFQLQQWSFHERRSMLRYTYTACLVSPVTPTAQLMPRSSQCWGFYNTQLGTNTQPVGLLITSDWPIIEATTYTTHNKH